MALGSTSSEGVELILRLDNKTFIRALKESQDASNNMTKSVKTDADEQTVALKRVKDQTEVLRGAFESLAGFVGIGGLAFGFKDLIQGGLALQTQQTQLQAALRATGQQAGNTADKLNSYAASLSSQGGFATTQNLGALTSFVRETHSATEAQKLLALATNIARGRNVDLATAQQAVARAYTGSVGRLQQLLGPMIAAREASVGLSVAHQKEIAALEAQYAFVKGPYAQEQIQQGIIALHLTAQQTALAQLTDKHTTAQKALAVATHEFSGATSMYSHNAQGQLSNLTNSVKNLVESLGVALLPAFRVVIAVLGQLAEFLKQHKTLVLAVAAAIGTLTAAYGGLRVVRAIKTMVLELGQAFRITGASAAAAGDEAAVGAETGEIAWKSFMASTIVGIVLVGLVELIEHWKTVEKVVVGVWHGIEAAFSDVWNFIKDHWQLIFSILTGPIGAAVIWIGTHFNEVKAALTGVWHFIESVASTIYNAITFPFRKAFDFIKAGWNAIKGALNFINPFGGNFLGLGFSQGGVVPRHFAWGGTSGTDTVPAWLSPGEGVLTPQGVANIGGSSGVSAINQGQPPAANVTVTPMPITLKLDMRTLYTDLVRFSLSEAARGPTSLVGGSLQTGQAGLPVAGAA